MANRMCAGRSYDITDPAQITDLYDRVGKVDAVVGTAGDVPFKPIIDLTPDDHMAAFRGKVLSQIELVRQGIPAHRRARLLHPHHRHPDPRADPHRLRGVDGQRSGGGVRAAAAIEIAPQRINAVSPTVFTESLDTYGDYFPGMAPVDLAEVARAFVRSIEGAQTGQVYIP